MLASAAMKPQSFAYVSPASVEEAVAALAGSSGTARVLAGGQSLVPVMNLRLARPELLVDINAVSGLDRVRAHDGWLELGATVRHRSIELGTPEALRRSGRLGAFLARVAGSIGHVPIRVRGTIGGSLAHADPNAEWPLVAVALGARVRIAGPSGERIARADDFFRHAFTTGLEPEELLTGLLLPLPRDGADDGTGPARTGGTTGTGFGFAEYARTSGAFALAAAAAVLQVDSRGPGVPATVRAATVAVGGVQGRPLRLAAVEVAAAGGPATAGALRAAAREAAAQLPDRPLSDLPPDYLAHLVTALVSDALVGQALPEAVRRWN